MTTGEQIYNIKRAHDSLSVVIHNRRHLPTVIWAIGCIVVALPLICMVFAGDFLLFMIGLFMLAVVVFMCIPILNWQFTGYETVSVNNQGIQMGNPERQPSTGYSVSKVHWFVTLGRHFTAPAVGAGVRRRPYGVEITHLGTG